ncbi:MAG: hypothetical protein ACK5LY_05260, partial [Lachnospirales bacterium]
MSKIYQNNENELIVLKIDDSPENPREWDNIFTFAFWSRSISGDSNNYTTPSDLLKEINKD